MTPMIGRSHVTAEPITFGLKLALMFDEFDVLLNVHKTRERIRVGKISGAVCSQCAHRPKLSVKYATIIGVILYRRAWSAIAVRSARRSSRRILHDSFSCTASVVSKMSDEVSP